jgi:hypothetical protein
MILGQLIQLPVAAPIRYRRMTAKKIISSVPGLLDKKKGQDNATFYTIKGGIFFPLYISYKDPGTRYNKLMLGVVVTSTLPPAHTSDG